MQKIEYSEFVTDQTPHCFWDFDVREKNREFLEGIDPEYYQYISNTDLDVLDSKEKHWAAMLLRQTYSQALELRA
jgi:hypothetical protein